jgi:hypothetical protein
MLEGDKKRFSRWSLLKESDVDLSSSRIIRHPTKVSRRSFTYSHYVKLLLDTFQSSDNLIPAEMKVSTESRTLLYLYYSMHDEMWKKIRRAMNAYSQGQIMSRTQAA